jgi:hypothetical protein
MYFNVVKILHFGLEMTRRDPMRKVGANKEASRGMVKSTRRIYPTRKAALTRKVDEEAET